MQKEKPTLCADKRRWVYGISGSKMCDFIIRFIEQFKKLQRVDEMKKVLEKITVLQVSLYKRDICIDLLTGCYHEQPTWREES